MRLDDEGFTSFYNRTRRDIWGYTYRVCGNAADADEIVAEAYCRLLQVADRVLDEDGLRPYLFRIAGNLLTDRWRRSVREQGEIRAPAPPASAAVAMLDEVARTFARLKRKERALLWLAYVEGQTHEEIAGSLGLKRGSVKVLLARARARLRDQIRALGSKQRREAIR